MKQNKTSPDSKLHSWSQQYFHFMRGKKTKCFWSLRTRVELSLPSADVGLPQCSPTPADQSGFISYRWGMFPLLLEPWLVLCLLVALPTLWWPCLLFLLCGTTPAVQRLHAPVLIYHARVFALFSQTCKLHESWDGIYPAHTCIQSANTMQGSITIADQREITAWVRSKPPAS